MDDQEPRRQAVVQWEPRPRSGSDPTVGLPWRLCLKMNVREQMADSSSETQVSRGECGEQVERRCPGQFSEARRQIRWDWVASPSRNHNGRLDIGSDEPAEVPQIENSLPVICPPHFPRATLDSNAPLRAAPGLAKKPNVTRSSKSLHLFPPLSPLLSS